MHCHNTQKKINEENKQNNLVFVLSNKRTEVLEANATYSKYYGNNSYDDYENVIIVVAIILSVVECVLFYV